MPEHPPRCLHPHPIAPQILCGLRAGHEGDHAGRAYWSQAGDPGDFPTAKLPPIRDTVLRRPPPPAVRELKGAELLRALAEQLDAGTFDEDDERDPSEDLFDAGCRCSRQHGSKGPHATWCPSYTDES